MRRYMRASRRCASVACVLAAIATAGLEPFARGEKLEDTCAAPPDSSAGNPPVDEFTGSASPPRTGWSRHIVRFNDYAPVDTHSAALSTLSLTESWTWVSRANPATKFPTDFGLIDIADAALSAVNQLVASAPTVRDIHPDHSFRHPLSVDTPVDTDTPKDASQASSQYLRDRQSEETPHGAIHGSSDAFGGVTKGPGRLSTRSSETLTRSSDPEEADRQAAEHMSSHARLVRDRLVAHLASEEAAGVDKGAVGADGSVERQVLLDYLAKLEVVAGEGVSGPVSEEVSTAHRKLLGSWGKLEDWGASEWLEEAAAKRVLTGLTQVTTALAAESIWAKGYSGAGVRVGVFDTGLRETHPHISNLRERSNWTHEKSLSDELGHGTFVAGVIGGHDRECPGFAPDVLLHTFKVFTNDQVSYTSWFLDAFNYAIATHMQIVNLSIGGPDFLDRPFVDKVQEITANGIIMVSAIGNDGPLYGTLNNPADQLDVIGVGGIDYGDHIASFSSRGMSTWELPLGYGRSKPDVMAYGRDVKGSKIGGGCRMLSGTSVASPVVTGAVCLLASTVPEEQRHVILNPATMKQALVEGTSRLAALNLFEQGQGRLNLSASMKILQSYTPRASIVPAALDLTDCPYMWPFCLQPLYAHAQPTMFNATILNGMGVWGRLAAPPEWVPSDEGGNLLDILFTWSDVLWPWSGHLSLHISVNDAGSGFTGTANGVVKFTVVSPQERGEAQPRTTAVTMKLRASIIPTPPRHQRLLWDQFHSLKYPPAYLPRDNLDVRSDILDWHGDHPATNYHALYTFLRSSGIYVELLGSPYTCFNATNYGALLIADSEEEFYPEEIQKLAEDVRHGGLGLLLFPEWYNSEALTRMRFFDDNTRSWWQPVTGGGNVPAMNDLIKPLGLGFGDTLLHGEVHIPGTKKLNYASGTHIVRAPAGAHTFVASLSDHSHADKPTGQTKNDFYHVLTVSPHGAGRVAAFGDASCLDGNHATIACHNLLLDLFHWVASNKAPVWQSELMQLDEPMGNDAMHLPQRPSPDLLRDVSFVVNTPIKCYLNSRVEFTRKWAALDSVLPEPTRVSSTVSNWGRLWGEAPKDSGALVRERDLTSGSEDGAVTTGATVRPSLLADSVTGSSGGWGARSAKGSILSRIQLTHSPADDKSTYILEFVGVAGVGILLLSIVVWLWRLRGHRSKVKLGDIITSSPPVVTQPFSQHRGPQQRQAYKS